MKTICKIFTTLITFTLLTTGYSQTEIKLSDKQMYFDIDAFNFNDRSFVINAVNGDFEKHTISIFDETGNLKLTKSFEGHLNWNYSNNQEPYGKFQKEGATHSLMNPETKLCYSLFTGGNEVIISIVDQKLIPEQFKTKTNAFGSGAWFSTAFVEHGGNYSNFDEEGNPFWIIQKGQKGYVFVKFDLKTKTAKVMAHETENSMYTSEILGEINDQIWYCNISDKGLKENEYQLTLNTIDPNSGVLTEKKTIKIPKQSEKDIANYIFVNKNAISESDNRLYFVVDERIDGRTTTSQVKFFSFDGEDLNWVYWDMQPTNIMYADFYASEISETTTRFLKYDGFNAFVYTDVNFEDKKIENISGVELTRAPDNPEFFTTFLFSEEIDAEISENVMELIKSPENTPYVFKDKNGKWFIVNGVNINNNDKGKGMPSKIIVNK